MAANVAARDGSHARDVPVKINDKVMLVGMQVKGWEIPDSENLLKGMEQAAEKRAFERAMKTLLALEGRGGSLSSEANDSWLSPTFAYYWAVGASVIALFVLAMQFLPKRESRKRR